MIKAVKVKKAFTLVELVTVIIIIAVLASLALPQYAKVIEKARGIEARDIILHLRRMALGVYQMNGTLPDNSNTCDRAGVPTDCMQNTHFFQYSVTGPDANSITISALRCALGGKGPQAALPGGYVALVTDLKGGGGDQWSASADF